MTFSSLLILLLMPFLGAITVAILPVKSTQIIRNVAIWISAATCLYSLYLIGWGDIQPTDSGLWQTYSHDWNTRLGMSFPWGVMVFHTPW